MRVRKMCAIVLNVIRVDIYPCEGGSATGNIYVAVRGIRVIK